MGQFNVIKIFWEKIYRNSQNFEKANKLKCFTINLTFCVFESGDFWFDKHWFRSIFNIQSGMVLCDNFIFQRKIHRNTLNCEKANKLKCFKRNLTFCVFKSGKLKCDNIDFDQFWIFQSGTVLCDNNIFQRKFTVTHIIFKNQTN